MTYVVLKGYLYDPIDCVKPAVPTKSGKVRRKDHSKSNFFFSKIIPHFMPSHLYWIIIIIKN